MTAFAIIFGVLLFVVGAAKLAGARPLVEQFDEFGLRRREMLAVGAVEVAGAVGLQSQTLDIWAAAGAVALMIGALYQHGRVGHPWRSMVPAAVVLVASAVFVAFAV